MADTNFVVTSLPAYVQTNRDVILKNFALVGGGTRKRIGIQTGVKKNAYINFLELAPTLQDGAACGFTEGGTATLSQREIKTAPLRVNMQICPETLLGKYAEYLVRVNANENSLPFEQYIVDGVVNEINRDIEKLIWQGDTTKTSDSVLKWVDGILKQAGAESSVVDVEQVAGADAYANIKQVYMALPEEAINRGAEIYVSPAAFREFAQVLVEKNLYHYSGPQAEAPQEFIFPGTNVKVVSTEGLSGSKQIVGTFASNLVYGCDMEGDAEDFALWYSQDNQAFRLAVRWNSGIGIAFPDQMVLSSPKA